jgi:hypothetical protein
MYLTILAIFVTTSLFAGLVITRVEGDFVSKELYHDNRFAELHNDAVVSIWDFKSDELTLIDHYLGIYTTISFADFTTEMQKQNRYQIESELQQLDEERRVLYANATNNFFRALRPAMSIVDTIMVAGYSAVEYNFFNDDVITQRMWLSKSLQDRIDKEVNPVNIRRMENIFKANRAEYLRALGIIMDPISVLIEHIESGGYVVRRVDYGLRDRENPEFERLQDENAGFISAVIERGVEPGVFTYHQRYRRLPFTTYQARVLSGM